MVSSQVAILVLLATPLLSYLTATPTTAHFDTQSDCRDYHPDMLGPAADSDEHRVCGRTTTPGGRSQSTPKIAPLTFSTATTKATTEPPIIDVGGLTSTISRQVMELYRAAENLHSSIVEDFDLKLPARQAPCFYAERNKDKLDSSAITAQAKLRSDHTTVEKYQAYFAQIQDPEMDEYEPLQTGIRTLRGNLGLLVKALNVPAFPSTSGGKGGQTFGDNCFSTSYYQRAVTLLNLQVFLKDYLLQDIEDLKVS